MASIKRYVKHFSLSRANPFRQENPYSLLCSWRAGVGGLTIWHPFTPTFFKIFSDYNRMGSFGGRVPKLRTLFGEILSFVEASSTATYYRLFRERLWAPYTLSPDNLHTAVCSFLTEPATERQHVHLMWRGERCVTVNKWAWYIGGGGNPKHKSVHDFLAFS